MIEFKRQDLLQTGGNTLIKTEVTVLCKTGLHARPANEFTKTASKYNSDIFIEFKGKKFNAKSIIHVMAAGISFGSKICIVADGDDEVEAANKLIGLIESNFGE